MFHVFNPYPTSNKIRDKIFSYLFVELRILWVFNSESKNHLEIEKSVSSITGHKHYLQQVLSFNDSIHKCKKYENTIYNLIQCFKLKNLDGMSNYNNVLLFNYKKNMC